MAALLIGTLALTACGDDADTDAGADSGSWPRTFTNADGSTTEIPEKPERIVSTTVSTSGTLLAIDAPLVASSTSGDGEFFAQWADIAAERGVDELWSAGSVDLEQVYGADPDLIVVSASGADSLVDEVDQFSEVAPTIVVDYGGQTWEELAGQLGEATGLEDQAAQTVEEFDAYVAETAAAITVPEGTANVVSYNGSGGDNPIARAGGAHALLLADLGFTIEDPDVSWHDGEERADFVFAPYERLTELTSETTFILSVDDAGAQGFADDPVLANLPSVQAGQVYGLGVNSFRVDLYSATEIVDGVKENFGA